MIGRREFAQGAGWLVLQTLAPGGGRRRTRARGRTEPPPDKLASNHNYFLFAGGGPIRGLIVTLDVTEEIIAPNGFTIQLNGYGPPDAGCVWQQYIVGVSHDPARPLTLDWTIENWPSKDLHEKLVRTAGMKDVNDLFNVHAKAYGPLPTFSAPSGRLPAGYRIRWELLSDAKDPDGLAIGAIFSFTDNHGRTWSSGPRKILDFDYNHTNVRVTREALAALTAFELNIVGITNGLYAFIELGAGTITYEASTPMTPQFQQPKAVLTRAASPRKPRSPLRRARRHARQEIRPDLPRRARAEVPSWRPARARPASRTGCRGAVRDLGRGQARGLRARGEWPGA